MTHGILLAGLYPEPHSFWDEVTGADQMRVRHGRHLLDRRSDGRFILEDRNSHLAAMRGVTPEEMAFIGVKAAASPRRAYDKIAAAGYWLRTLGSCPSDPTALPYQHICRPIFPLDDRSSP